MLDFKNYNDYELIYYIKDGNEAALDFMIKKYEPLIKKLTTSFIRFSDKRDDLIQEGFLILMKCIDKYNSNMNCTFYSYFIVSIRHHFYHLMNDEYYKMPILSSDVIYNSMTPIEKSFKGKDFFKDELKISIFDNCIIGNISIYKYSKEYNIPYKKALSILEEIKFELRNIYFKDNLK